MNMQLSVEDLKLIHSGVENLFEDLKGKHMFLTGGTGFFGKWILEYINWANTNSELELRTTVLSRKPDVFQKEFPHINHPLIEFVEGDICSFEFKPRVPVDLVMHAATEASVKLNRESPQKMLDVIVKGTDRLLQHIREWPTSRLLLLSSGAIYGSLLDGLPVSESKLSGPNPCSALSAYGEGKRVSETMAAILAKETSTSIVVARCFAFVGPYLPLDGSFAAGNFLLNALSEEPIEIKSDGSAVRSYMYMADLVVWLFHIMLRGKNSHAYNVGSDEELSVKELANLVASLGRNVDISIQGAKNSQTIDYYVPNINKSKEELGLVLTHDNFRAFSKTYKWLEEQR